MGELRLLCNDWLSGAKGMKHANRRQNTEEEEDLFVLETTMMRGGGAPPGGRLSYLKV